jgi:hypothetical protein
VGPPGVVLREPGRPECVLARTPAVVWRASRGLVVRFIAAGLAHSSWPDQELVRPTGASLSRCPCKSIWFRGCRCGCRAGRRRSGVSPALMAALPGTPVATQECRAQDRGRRPTARSSPSTGRLTGTGRHPAGAIPAQHASFQCGDVGFRRYTSARSRRSGTGHPADCSDLRPDGFSATTGCDGNSRRKHWAFGDRPLRREPHPQEAAHPSDAHRDGVGRGPAVTYPAPDHERCDHCGFRGGRVRGALQLPRMADAPGARAGQFRREP